MSRMIFAAVLMIWPLQASADAFSDAAGRYKVQPSSVIHFSVAQMGGAAIEGEFKRFRGTFQLDGKDVARSKVDISIDSGSVSAADPRIEEFIKSESVFDSANHPTVRFVSTGATRSGDRTAAIEGRLSAKGITRPTRFSVTLQEQTAGTLKFRVTGKLSRALFKMDVGTPIYSNIVVLDMTLIGHRN